VILGTAGHIDHGKTALVRALTGTDTDRLKEEKARGITIELGFAELASEGRPHFGVVDVPGHEAFVRAMVAGAAGMDVVLLVVAADESVMPQTREHLAIVSLLQVPELVVALTKVDAVEAEWLELVDAEVEELLADTRYAGATRIATSATAGTGLDELLDALTEAAERARRKGRDDLARLPLDRVFTIQGTGTVATGTLWTGELTVGTRVRVLPGEVAGRIRALQAHGRSTERVEAGDRVAVALTGGAVDRESILRGATLVDSPEWEASWMLTTRIEMLPGSSWSLEHNQRVHVHHGTAEVLARCALLEEAPLGPGDSGWVQLRLEHPLVARAGDRLVIRAYSPVTTIGGGEIAEPIPRKRNRLSAAERDALQRLLSTEPSERVTSVLELEGWSGCRTGQIPVLTGISAGEVPPLLDELTEHGGLVATERAFAPHIRGQAEEAVLSAVERAHREDALRPSVPLAVIRDALPRWAPAELGEAVISALVETGRLETVEGEVRGPGFEPSMTPDQERASAELYRLLTAEGLASPFVDELPPELTGRDDFWSIVRHLEKSGRIRTVADGYYVGVEVLEAAVARVRELLGGQTGLGPGDFREALPLTRKHLIPLLTYLDGQGTTTRLDDGRDVPLDP